MVILYTIYNKIIYTGRNPSTFKSGWTSPQGIIVHGT